MSDGQYDPEKHHRRSIRLKGYDYAGGGTYFVTICAHRVAGDIFADPAVQNMVGRVWESLPASPSVGAPLVGALSPPLVGAQHAAPLLGAKGVREEGTHEGCPYCVMPDHFHGLVRMRGGQVGERVHLGEVVGAFKSLVVHEYIAGVKAGRFAPFPGKIWHRNYYEVIVRSPEAETRIAEYIRMNPWKLVQHATLDGQSFRMIGNHALVNHDKIAVLCSRRCPADILSRAEKRAQSATSTPCFIGGFHSPPEKALLAALLQSGAKIVCCPAWGIDTMRIPSSWLPALEANRMLILEMRNREGNLAAAAARNRFVLEYAEKRWLPYVAPNGMLDRMIRRPAT